MKDYSRGERVARLVLVPLLGGLLLTTGCMSAAKVQEMIDASHRDQTEALKAHESSINVLKQSSVKVLEQNQAQADTLVALQKQLEAALAQLKPIQGNAEAAKVMSAANTVRVAELSDAMMANKASTSEMLERMNAIDVLFEEVMIGHFRKIAESANAAIAALQLDDVATTNGAPAGMAEPIEIVAPDTAAVNSATNGPAVTNKAAVQQVQ